MESPASAQSASTYGIGARVSLHPMSNRYIGIILGALADAAPHARGLDITTGAVSTFVGGEETRIVAWLTALLGAAAHRADGEHLAASVLFSRGCPGEVTCALPAGPWASTDAIEAVAVGIDAVAEWSLYPLLDAGATTDHMAPILAAIAAARASGLYAGSDHYVTQLRGDIGAIIALVARAWRDTGSAVQHVTSHLSLSINSPTEASHA